MVTLWCYSDLEPKCDDPVWYWQRFIDENVNLSIPRYLEDHSEELRAKYIAFIHDLGEHEIEGQRLVDWLKLDSDFSYWWMGQLAEKSPFKSPRLYDCLRLLAVEAMLLEKKPSALTVYADDANLVQAVRVLCDRLQIDFVHRSRRWFCIKDVIKIKNLYRMIPYWIQGVISLRHALFGGHFENLKNRHGFLVPPQFFVVLTSLIGI